MYFIYGILCGRNLPYLYRIPVYQVYKIYRTRIEAECVKEDMYHVCIRSAHASAHYYYYFTITAAASPELVIKII
jgi:hypothetical protein